MHVYKAEKKLKKWKKIKRKWTRTELEGKESKKWRKPGEECVCVCVCVWVCGCVCICACVRACVRVCTRVRVCVCVCLSMYMCFLVCLSACVRACAGGGALGGRIKYACRMQVCRTGPCNVILFAQYIRLSDFCCGIFSLHQKNTLHVPNNQMPIFVSHFPVLKRNETGSWARLGCGPVPQASSI